MTTFHGVDGRLHSFSKTTIAEDNSILLPFCPCVPVHLIEPVRSVVDTNRLVAEGRLQYQNDGVFSDLAPNCREVDPNL